MDRIIPARVVITGIGLVTPLGCEVDQVWSRVERGESAWSTPSDFAASAFACPWYAKIPRFAPESYVAEPKMLRLMNWDAKLAVAAAHLALQDAGLRIRTDYQPEDIALFGSTGLAGLPLAEVRSLIRNSTNAAGQFDLGQFGREGLRAINPLLSFKILGNMPVCFVSICENIQGPNAIYTPWEGQGAQAIYAGLRAIHSGEVPAALVGGCDAKTHELAFITLEQRGLFEAWKTGNSGTVPGEGAVFLVLEEETRARRRGAHVYACLAGVGFATQCQGESRDTSYAQALRKCLAASGSPSALVSAADGDPNVEADETRALARLNLRFEKRVRPKLCAGNLFAAAAALQVAGGAVLACRTGQSVVANCFGHGSEQAVFLLEVP